MAIFELQGPDGATYEIDAPDQAQAIAAFRKMSSAQAARPETPGWMKSFASAYGVDPSRIKMPTEAELEKGRRQTDDVVRSVASGATFGLADELAAGARTLGNDQTYSQNLAEERARDASISPYVKIPGEIAGSVLTGTGLARGGATLMNVANPTVRNMALRGAGEGAAYGAAHGFGRGEGGFTNRAVEATKGAITGGVTGAATGAVAGAMAPRTQPPTADQLREQANRAYAAAHEAGVTLRPETFGRVVDDIAEAAREAGIDRTIHPRATAALARLNEARGGSPSLQDLDILRRVLRAAASSNEADERRIAQIMIERLDDHVNSLGAADVAAGDALRATTALNEGRNLWGRLRRAETIGELFERAENRAGQFSGSGYENALRTEFRNLAMNPRRMRGFSEEEREAILRVVRGGPIDNALRNIGRLAPRGVVSGGFHLGVGAAVDPVVGGATMAVGEGARRGATALTHRNADRAYQMMLAGRDAPPAAPLPLTDIQRQMFEAALIAQAQRGSSLLDPIIPPQGAGLLSP